jgi:hypothetical protein
MLENAIIDGTVVEITKEIVEGLHFKLPNTHKISSAEELADLFQGWIDVLQNLPESPASTQIEQVSCGANGIFATFKEPLING